MLCLSGQLVHVAYNCLRTSSVSINYMLDVHDSQVSTNNYNTGKDCSLALLWANREMGKGQMRLESCASVGSLLLQQI